MTDAPSTRPPLRLALWQEPQHSTDVAGNLDRLVHAARQAKAGGADPLITPEMFATGYCIDAQTVQRLAEPADGPVSQQVCAVAAEVGIGIVYGFAKGASDERVFDAAQFFGGRGVRQVVYRKTHLFGALERANYSASDGSGASFEINGWRFGCLTCYDAEFPKGVRQMALRGAEVVVVPTALAAQRPARQFWTNKNALALAQQPPDRAGHDGVERAVTMAWIWRSRCAGTGGHAWAEHALDDFSGIAYAHAQPQAASG